jgi:hypothetical protein
VFRVPFILCSFSLVQTPLARSGVQIERDRTSWRNGLLCHHQGRDLHTIKSRLTIVGLPCRCMHASGHKVSYARPAPLYRFTLSCGSYQNSQKLIAIRSEGSKVAVECSLSSVGPNMIEREELLPRLMFLPLISKGSSCCNFLVSPNRPTSHSIQSQCCSAWSETSPVSELSGRIQHGH